MLNKFITDAKIIFLMPWNDKNLLRKSYATITLLFVVAILPLPYEFYFVLRIIVCICLYIFYKELKRSTNGNKSWTFVIAALAVLYNPVLPIQLGAHIIWTLVNVATLFILYLARLDIEKLSEGPEQATTSTAKTDTTASVCPSHIVAGSNCDEGFNEYRAEFFSEVKRLSGKTARELHLVELTDDEGTRRAYNAGVDAKALALQFLKHGNPPMPHQFGE